MPDLRGIVIRHAAHDDADLLADMLVAAVNWSTRWKKSRRRVLATPQAARYVAGWPREKDVGVVAQAGEERVGAAWLRFFPASAPGYGFVAPGIPELTIGVAAPWRGRGIGRALLRAVETRARAAGIGKISLSVEQKNLARKLYLAEGYKVVRPGDRGSDTMVKDLRGRPT